MFRKNCMLSFTENMVNACLRGDTLIDTVCYSSDTLQRSAMYQFFSCGFITAIAVNPPERKLAKRISVQCSGAMFRQLFHVLLFVVTFTIFLHTKQRYLDFVKKFCISVLFKA